MVAFYLPGGIPVYAFSLFASLGVVIGLAWLAWQAPPKMALRQVQAGLWASLGGLLGGRAAFVAVNWSYYQGRPLEILPVNQGGLAWPGALAGGLLALALVSWVTHSPLAELADNLTPLFAILAVCTWLGCWLDGVAYGAPVAAWWGVPARDEWGNVALRWPLQPLGALLTVAWFWLVERYASQERVQPGMAASLGLLGFSLMLLGFSFMRADPALLWLGMRLEAWAALGFACLGLAGLAMAVLLAKRQ